MTTNQNLHVPTESDLEGLDLAVFNEWRHEANANPRRLELVFAWLIILNVFLAIAGGPIIIGGVLLFAAIFILRFREGKLYRQLKLDRKRAKRLRRIQAAISPTLVSIFKHKRPVLRIAGGLLLAILAISAFSFLESYVTFNNMKGKWELGYRHENDIVLVLLILSTGIAMSFASLHLLIFSARRKTRLCLLCGHEEDNLDKTCPRCNGQLQ